MMPPENENTNQINQGNVTNSNVAKGKYIEQNIAHHHYGIPPELFAQYAADLCVTDNALSNFFKILQHANVDRADLDSKLREIAQNYKNLQERAAQLVSDDPEVQALQQKAVAALEQADFENADKWLLEAIEKNAQALVAMKEVIEKRTLSQVSIIATLAESKRTQLRYAEAADLYQQAADLLPQEHEEQQALYLNAAGLNFNHAGKYEQALPLFERSLAIREKVLGEHHPDVAQSLNNLAGLYWDKGKYVQASLLLERCLAIDEKVYGKNHPDVATDLNNLAVLYDNQANYSQALPLYERSLAIFRSVFDEKHPSVQTVKSNYESCLRKFEQDATD